MKSDTHTSSLQSYLRQANSNDDDIHDAVQQGLKMEKLLKKRKKEEEEVGGKLRIKIGLLKKMKIWILIMFGCVY